MAVNGKSILVIDCLFWVIFCLWTTSALEQSSFKMHEGMVLHNEKWIYTGWCQIFHLSNFLH